MRKNLLLIILLFIIFTGSYDKEINATSSNGIINLTSTGVPLAPKILTQIPKKVTLKEGEDFRLKISYEANPAPDVTILKDGEKIKDQNRFVIRVIKDQNTVIFEILCAKLEDSGTYDICLNNGVGCTTKSFELYVEPK